MPTQKNSYDILKDRGFVNQSTDETSIKQLLSKQKVNFYIGFDPTASSLHIGNLVGLMTAAHLQNQEHKPIILVGGGTGLIGDPSGKDKARPIMNHQEINKNAQALKKQISKIINFKNSRALLMNNADWLTKLNYIEFLRDFGTHFSVNRLLNSEAVKIRLEKGLSFLEFNYQLLQAYDFWHLFKTKNCILQIGGADQWGNIVAGVELVRRLEEKEAYGITIPLITTSDGKKMGKTEKGAVWLDAKLTSPYEYYQFWINTDDADAIKFLLLFTFLPVEKIEKLKKLKGSEIKKAKEVLAFEATKILPGEKEAKKAAEASATLFGKENKKADSIPTITISKNEARKGISAFKFFVLAGLAKSSGEAQRLIKQGGGYLNEKRLDNPNLLITEKDFSNGELMLRAGKKKYQKIKLR
ncbi:tyrosine--tRNA ligase [Candidatus Wolfebacteria bacterium RBG_13_41_7]|uniref:Tyrosine--tRNA ligase n=1 Tax=Candidatus Wolfebacteria bacterium RBG_13_41_7 TaxID=1802554 RepID=A0A1F8DM99_9BACT|nr:MAG: tyrosine--tRNA ligase [Candidatus Wolfebacteria bacterium RBG_13_41_7]